MFMSVETLLKHTTCFQKVSFSMLVATLLFPVSFPTQSALLLPPTKEEVNAFAWLSVSKITQKRVHGFG